MMEVINRRKSCWHRSSSDRQGSLFFSKVEIVDFVEWNQKVLGQYVDLSEDYHSHNTFEQVMSMISYAHFHELNRCFQEEISFILSKEFNCLISLDGKFICSNRSKNQSANHILTSY